MLLPWTLNPRRNDPAIPRVAESILRFGFGAPVLARAVDKEVIAGHTRLAATLSLLNELADDELPAERRALIEKRKLDFVPVRYMDLSEADAHLLALADNRLGEFAEWDDVKIAEVLKDFRALDADAAAVAGFTDADIDLIVRGLAPPSAGEVERTHGSVDDPSTWPDLKYRVPPETYRAFERALAVMPGNQPHEKILALAQRVLPAEASPAG